MLRRNTLILLSSALSLIVSTPVVGDSDRGIWVCPAEAKEKFNQLVISPIVEENAEKFLVRIPRYQISVMKVLFVFAVPYSRVLPRLRRLSSARFGEAQYNENTSASFLGNYLKTIESDYDFKVEARFARQYEAEARAILDPLGIGINDFRQASIVTDEFNENGSSQLTVRVIDGEDVLGFRGTLVVVSRQDHATVFGLTHGGIGFSSQKWGVVTGTEYELIAALARALGARFSVWPTGSYLAIRDTESFIAAKRWLQSQNTASPEPGAPLDIGRCPGAPAGLPADRNGNTVE